jgi:peptidoglycan/LPS O-acetylase OafA/YrhL
VVLAHTNGLFGYHMTGGVVAVQAFFMISGFYMALILSEKYAGVPYRLFITNRLLRIFPAYWAVVALTVAWSLLCAWQKGYWARLQPYVDYSGTMPPTTVAWLVWTNSFLIGHESCVFLEFDGASRELAFTHDFRTSQPPLHQFMLVPQAWSLSLELVFYLVAPALLRLRTSVLAAVAFGALVLRAWIYHGLGWRHDPWMYRFLPAELALFLAGALSFRLFIRLKQKRLPDWAARVVTIAVWTVTLAYHYLPAVPLGPWIAYGALFMALPFLFLQSTSAVDRFVGELSYPIYVSHVFAMTVMSANVFGGAATLPFRTIAATLLVSVLLYRLVNAPLERWRQRRVSEARSTGSRVREGSRGGRDASLAGLRSH